jgi:hypothetical protein
MKVSIQGRNINEYRNITEQAVRFYAKELMSTRMCNTLNIVVKIQKTTLSKNTRGTCYAKAIGSSSVKNHEIIIKNTGDTLQMFETLAHEMVHVEQKAMKRLQVRLWKSDKQYHYRWDGKEMGTAEQNEYWTRPWEVEARSKQKDLLNKFRNSLTTKKAA